VNIATKYNIGDTVYFIGKYEICRDEIHSVVICKEEPLAYRLEDTFNSIYENQLFSSLESLIEEVKTILGV
jgi:hypothetical protein